MVKKERKITMSFVLSPKIVEKMDQALQEGKYSGQSDLASIAITEHLLKEEIKADEQKLLKVIEMIPGCEALQELLDEMPSDKESRIKALKKKGYACVELGEYKEAKECFAKAEELESGQPTHEPLKENIQSNHRAPSPEEQRKAKENLRALDEHLANEHNTTSLSEIHELVSKIKPISEELNKDKISDVMIKRGIIE